MCGSCILGCRIKQIAHGASSALLQNDVLYRCWGQKSPRMTWLYEEAWELADHGTSRQRPDREKNDDGFANAATVASPRFAAYFKVRLYEMDTLGHVNNAVYLHYLEQAAYEHSTAVGFSDEQTRALGGQWIVRQHEIEYLRPAMAGDILQVVTWAVEFKGARAFRAYAIYRYAEGSDGISRLPDDGFLAPDTQMDTEPLVRARTVWVWVDVISARPRRIPAELHATFFSGAGFQSADRTGSG